MEVGVKGIEVMVSPLRRLHLDNWNTVKMLYIMGILAIALLFTATLNYVLISLSSLAYRAKAIGVTQMQWGRYRRHIRNVFVGNSHNRMYIFSFDCFYHSQFQ